MYYALVSLAVILTAVAPGHRLPLPLPARLERQLARSAIVPLAVLVLVAAQHAYLKLLLRATYDQHPVFDLMQRMPIRFMSSRGPGHLANGYGNEFAALALLESLALFALYHGLLKPTRSKIAIVAVGALLACADAVLSRSATSPDMYAYIGFTILGDHAYAPPQIAFGGEYSVINAWWHNPMVPAVYGPLWLAVAAAIAAAGHTLLMKIVALRILGALTLGATVAALAALKLPVRVLAIVAINPALTFEFVANVHNDLFGVLLLLCARFATVRGVTWAAVAFAAAAGLVKLPFMLFAALAFVPDASPIRRVRAWSAGLAIALYFSWLGGGSSYLKAVFQTAERSTGGHVALAVTGGAAVLKAIAVATVALALICGTFVEGAAWSLPALGALLYPWYLSWTFTYAVTSEQSLRNVAIALPVMMLVTDDALTSGVLLPVIAGAAYIWLAMSIVHALALKMSHAAQA